MSHIRFGDYQDNFVFENATRFFFRPANCFVSGEIFGQSFIMRVNQGIAEVILPGNGYQRELDVSLPENGGVNNDCTIEQAEYIFRKLVSDWDFSPRVLSPVQPFAQTNAIKPLSLLTF